MVHVAPGQLIALPNPVTAGRQVALWWHRASCNEQVTVSDQLIAGTPAVASIIEDEIRITAPATVRPDLQPGTHAITVTCYDTTLSTTLTVTRPGAVTVVPKGAAETGGVPPAPDTGTGLTRPVGPIGGRGHA